MFVIEQTVLKSRERLRNYAGSSVEYSLKVRRAVYEFTQQVIL